MSKVFISHSSKDNEFALKLAHDLLTNDIPVWLDKYELSLGDSLYDKIFTGIENSNYLIVIISGNYNSTLWTSKELKAILSKEDRDNKKYLIPIKIDNSKVPLVIFERVYQNFETEYDNSIRYLIRYLKGEDVSVTSIPIEERQVILNFENFVDVDIALIKASLSDFHSFKNVTINKKQIFFSAYSIIDKLLVIGKNNLAGGRDLLMQYNEDSRAIEKYIEFIRKGILIMLNEFKPNNNIEYISISIYWYVKLLMHTIYSLITRYINKMQLKELNLEGRDFYYFPNYVIVNDDQFNNFFKTQGKPVKLQVFDKKDSRVYCSINVGGNCSILNEVLDFYRARKNATITDVFSIDFVYKYFIPQSVLAKVSNESRNVLMTNFDDYLVGLG